MTQPPKSMVLSYLLWFLLGGFGGHRFYLGRILSAFAMWVPFLGAMGIALTAQKGAETLAPDVQQIMAYAVLGLMAGWILWLIVDAFMIPSMVRRANAPASEPQPQAVQPEPEAAPSGELPAEMPTGRDYQPPVAGRDYVVPPTAGEFHRSQPQVTSYQRPRKQMWVAYLLWFLLGGFGAHRFYLNRGASAIFMILLYIGGIVVAIVGLGQGSQSSMILGAMLVCAAATWLLIDLFTIPGMVESCNNQDEDLWGPYMPGPTSFDPGFGATLAKAGADPNRPRKKGVPDGYVMPWREEREQEQEIYRPGRD